MLFQFEVKIKTGPHWQPVGLVRATDSLSAARTAYRLYHAARIKVRPEDSQNSWCAYRFR